MARYRGKRRKKISSWKKLRLSRKLKHRLKILGLALVVVFATAIVSGAVALYQFFTKPMAGATGAASDDVTLHSGRFNLLLVNLEDSNEPTSLIRELSVIALNPGENDVFVVKLPVEVEVAVPLGFGTHPLKEVYSLGALTKPQANLDLTALTVKKLLAVPIDGYIVTDASGLGRIDQYLGDGLGMLKLLPNLFTEVRRNVKTNLTFTSLLQVGRFILRAESSGEAWEISKEELFDWQHLDWELQKHFLDSKIVEERLKIQILNATEQSGLATHLARYVKNLGGDVIIIGNADQMDLRQSFLVTDPPLADGSYTVRRLKEVLQIEEVGPPASESPQASRAGERADLTIICGLDSWKNL